MKKLDVNQTYSSFVMKLALSLTLLTFMGTSLHAGDCQLNCNQNVQVSLNNDCEAHISYDVMLEDPNNPALCTPNGPSAYVVTVMASDGSAIGSHLTRANLVDGWCGVTYLVKVKHWSSGNICWGSIRVEDKIAPKGNLEDIIIDCDQSLPPFITSAYSFASDNCSYVSIKESAEWTLSTNCEGPYSASFMRAYTIEDECGNSTIVDHKIYLRPVTPVIPPDYSASCKTPSTHPDDTGYPTIGGKDLKPGGKIGYCEYSTDYVDWTVEVCPEAQTVQIVRTWKIANNCTNEIWKYDQKIEIYNRGPWVDPPHAEALWLGTNVAGYKCEYYGPLPAPGIGDKCSSITAIKATVFHADASGAYNASQPIIENVDVRAGQPIRLEEGPFVVVYQVSDACHATTTIAALGFVYDNTPPVAVADTKTSVDITPEECVSKLYAKNLDSGSYDNCEFGYMEVARMSASGAIGSFGSYVTFDETDACATHMVVFRVWDDHGGKDGYGLYSQVMVEVEVQDNFIALENLQDKTIDCSGDDDWDAADAFDTPRLYGCTAEIYDVQNFQSNLNCGRSVYTRVWYARNCKGITTSTRQRIYTRYVGTITVKFPKDYTVQCREDGTYSLDPDDLPSGFDRPVVTETGCAVSAVSEPQDVRFSHDGDDGCFKIKRTWIVWDWCNDVEVDRYTQTIKVIDNVRPIVEAGDVDVCIETGCDVSFDVPAPTITDCTETTTSVSWVFTAKDGTVLPPGVVSVGQTVTFGPGVLELKYIVEDACGNFGNAFSTVTITDCKNPTPFCRNPINTPIMNTTGDIEIWASDFLLYADDNCTDPSMVEASVKIREHLSSDTPTTSLSFTCADLTFSGGFASVSLDVFVYDMAGNSDFCTVQFVIQDNENTCGQGAVGDVASLTTNFNDEIGEFVENVKVDLSGDLTMTNVTNAAGTVLFSVPMHNNYDVEGSKSEDLLNGVTTYDIVVMTRHILGITELNSPYRLIAADVNNSGSISTGDVVALRRAILAITDEFTNNDSWRFVDAKYIFPDPRNPWAESFPERVSVTDLNHDMNANFIGIKIGDLNGSAVANELLGSSSPTAANMVIGLEERELVAGQRYDIEFKASDFNHFGYQFTIGFDKSAVSVDDVQAGTLEGLSQNNFGLQLLDQGAITTSWDNPNGATLEDNETLFTLSITAKANTRLSEVFNINSTVTTAEAVNSGLEPTGVALEFYNRASASFELFQNTPNPFSDHTLIQFNLPGRDQVQLRIFDVAGKVLHAQTATLDKGTHQIRINKADLGATGVLYYQVETSTDVATKKMISLD